jgi:hypothetical protein
VVNIHLMRAPPALRRPSQAAIWAFEGFAVFDASVEALAAQDADFDLDHVEPGGVLWSVVELQAAHDAMRLDGREGLVEAGPANGSTRYRGRRGSARPRDNADRRGRACNSAKSRAVRRSVTLTVRQGRWASRKTKTLAVPLRRYSQS